MKKTKRYYSLAALAATLLFVSAPMAQQGMMHGTQQGYGYHHDGSYRQPVEPIDRKQAKKILENYVRSTENPNLKPGSVTDKGDVYEAKIVTKDGSLVDRIRIDKDTGRVSSRYKRRSGVMRSGRDTGYGRSGNWNFCPYCGSDINPGRYHHMGPGMMGHGYGMGSGMQHGMGYGYEGGMPHRGWNRPLDKEDAEQILKNYLEFTGNPNLKVGKIKETDTAFEAEVVTKKKEDLVNRITIDKQTGRMRAVY